MQRISPFFWFNNQAEQAARFYTRIFKKSRLIRVARYSKAGAQAAGRKAGSVMLVEFELEGQRFMALNGGPRFKLNQAISFVVNCRNQAEVDYYWKRLSAGGKEVHCGWLEDRFGISWQVVPTMVGELIGGKDPAKAERVMQAVLQMVKLDIKKLKQAARGA